MNPLEFYKLLPRTNCGECGPKTCMSFAVLLKTSPEALDQCRHLGADARQKIQSMLLQGDWRDELTKTLMEEVSGIDLGAVASDLGCRMENGKLIVKCVGMEYSIDGKGVVEPEARSKWIKILLLHYVRFRGKGAFTGKWINFSDLKGGFVKASTFLRECEDPLRQLTDQDLKGVSMTLGRLGAVQASGYPGDLTMTIDLLPRVRALLLYHKGDEEFPSSLKMLFDGVTGEFLDVESIVFLCEGLVHTIAGMLRR